MLLGGGFAFLTMLQTAALAAHAAPLSRCRRNAGSTPATISIVGILVGVGAKFSPRCRTRCWESFSWHDDKLTIHLCPLLWVCATDLFRPSSCFLRRASSLRICFCRCARNVASPRFLFLVVTFSKSLSFRIRCRPSSIHFMSSSNFCFVQKFLEKGQGNPVRNVGTKKTRVLVLRES